MVSHAVICYFYAKQGKFILAHKLQFGGFLFVPKMFGRFLGKGKKSLNIGYT